jgi:hypothetical protein
VETRTVLGFFPFHTPVSFALVPVAAEIIDGKLTKVADVRKRFPRNGDVYIHERNIPSDFARFSAGLWEVKFIDTDEQENSERFAHFVSTAVLTTPHEIVHVDCDSEEPDVAREHLLSGMHLPYRLTSDPFLEFCDGIIVGPVRTSALPEGIGFRCPDNALEHPLRAWRSRAALEPLTLPNQSLTRTFVWNKPLPKADFYIDFSPLQDAIRSVVKFIAKEGPGTYIIPKRQQDLLAEKLSAGGMPEWVEARRERVLRLLGQSVEIPEHLEASMKVLLEHPTVKERLILEEKRAIEAGKQNLKNEEKDLNKRVAKLGAEEKRLNQSLLEISAVIKKEEERGLQQAEELERTIRIRALKAKEEVGALLADVAILQPFFGTNSSPSPTPIALSVMPVEFQERTPRETPKSFPEAAGILQRNLGSHGLIPISARATARDVLAAICCRQLVLFQGSLGSLVAQVVARSLASRHVTTFQVPVGFAENGKLESHLRQAASEHECAAFIIEGANRSCIDAYGSFLTEIATDRIFRLGDPVPNLILLGTVLDGPSALPPGPGLTALGPIFHTDCLTWMPPSAGSFLVDGQLPALPRDFGMTSPADGMTLDKWCKMLRGAPSALWSRNVEAAFTALHCSPEKFNYPSALEAVSFGWLIPRAIAMGVDLAERAELLAEVRNDARVEMLLSDVMHVPAS